MTGTTWAGWILAGAALRSLNTPPRRSGLQQCDRKQPSDSKEADKKTITLITRL